MANTFSVDPYYVELSKVQGAGVEEIDVPFEVMERLCADGDGCEIRLAMMRTTGTLGAFSGSGLLFTHSPTTDSWRLQRHDKVQTDTGQNGNGDEENLLLLSFGPFICRLHDDGAALFPTYRLRYEDIEAGHCILRISD